MKPHSMEEKISYRLFLMGFLGLLFTAALCIFVFHRAFTAQAWDDLEKESDLIRAGYDLTSEPQQLSFFVTGDLRITNALLYQLSHTSMLYSEKWPSRSQLFQYSMVLKIRQDFLKISLDFSPRLVIMV